MRQLPGIDGFFLHMETPELPMHTLKVLVLSGPCTTFRELSSHASEWLARVPVLTQRLADLPWGLGQPLLFTDAQFELRHHVRFERLAPEAAPDALDTIVGEVARKTLRRDRPLWELLIVDGLAHGRWAAVVKIHHALADGAAAVAMLTRLLAGPTEPGAKSEAMPSFARRLGYAMRSLGRTALAIPTLVARSAGMSLAIWRRRHRGETRPASLFQAPKLGFNGKLSSARRFARVSFPLVRFAAMEPRTGAKLNDLLLTVMAGALRRYLEHKCALPSLPLVASVPVGGDHQHVAGNDVTSLFAAVPTHLADPLARLQAVRESMLAAKDELGLGVAVERAWVEALPPFAVGPLMNAPNAFGITKHRPPLNLVISNVHGPLEPVFVGGREIESIHSVGPLVANVGLNVTIWSYRGQLFFGLLAGGDAVNDLPALVAQIAISLDELEAATKTSNHSQPATTSMVTFAR